MEISLRKMSKLIKEKPEQLFASSSFKRIFKAAIFPQEVAELTLVP